MVTGGGRLIKIREGFNKKKNMDISIFGSDPPPTHPPNMDKNKKEIVFWAF